MSNKTIPWLTDRPTLDPEKKRSKTIMVTMTPGEWNDLRALSEMCTTRPATLMHNLLVKGLKDNREVIDAHHKAQKNLKASGLM